MAISRRLEDKLHDCGCEMDPDQFKSLLEDTLKGMYRSWNDEELMHHPQEALRYCQAIRQATGSFDLADEVILRALSAMRKHP
jgi:hypothetical protein